MLFNFDYLVSTICKKLSHEINNILHLYFEGSTTLIFFFLSQTLVVSGAVKCFSWPSADTSSTICVFDKFLDFI